MIVVAIIGVLAAIAVPNLLGAIERARKQACEVNRKNIDGAKLQWSLVNSQPSDAQPTDEDLFGKGRFIDHKPNCPAGGRYNVNVVEDKCTCSVVAHAN